MPPASSVTVVCGVTIVCRMEAPPPLCPHKHTDNGSFFSLGFPLSEQRLVITCMLYTSSIKQSYNMYAISFIVVFRFYIGLRHMHKL